MTERTDSVRVYINGRGVDVAANGTALDAVQIADADAARLIVAGERALADSRGLPVAATAPVHGGAIFRVISNRAGKDGGR